ncbi:unnamed protein product [Closterium sp. Naga37s-1]|nr:unnamed protein product [Closterium sp. Naga37s-1]
MHPYSLPHATPAPLDRRYDDKGLTVGGRDLDWPCGSYDNKGFTVGGRDLDWPCGSHISYDDKGFTVGGRDLDSSILCVGDVALCWSPSCLADVTPDSLALFQLIRPQPELLLLGTGQRMQAVPGQLREFVRACGMKLEVLSTFTQNAFAVQLPAASAGSIKTTARSPARSAGMKLEVLSTVSASATDGKAGGAGGFGLVA